MIRYNEQGSRVVGQERVLVIEDQLSCRQLVSDYLRQNGYSVDEAASLSAGRRAVDVMNPSIVILDLSLDDGDGFDILPDLKKRGISALVLSSRSDALDRILSFELGAADYMSKPVELREMVLRLRRMETLTPGARRRKFIMKIGDFALDVENRQVIRDGRAYPRMTRSELALLRQLIERRPAVVSKQEIGQLILSKAFIETTRSIDMLVSQLRKKIDVDPKVSLIRTVRGSGDYFDVPAA